MEGKKFEVRIKVLQPPTLAVTQDFVGGRLEKQWRSKAYELVAPTVCVVAGKNHFADSVERSVCSHVTVPSIAKGA
jgi:hypothetical protein